MTPADLQFGHILNSRRATVRPWSVVEQAIRLYQLHKWGRCSEWRHTHSAMYVGDGAVFEVTWPKAQYIPLKDYLQPRYIYDVYAYRQKREFTLAEKAVILSVYDQIEGTWYDVGDLLDFLVNKLLFNKPSPIPVYKPVFGTRKQMVCASGIIAGLVKCWLKCWSDTAAMTSMFPRPGGRQPVELTDPATFANYAATFVPLGRLETA